MNKIFIFLILVLPFSVLAIGDVDYIKGNAYEVVAVDNNNEVYIFSKSPDETHRSRPNYFIKHNNKEQFLVSAESRSELRGFGFFRNDKKKYVYWGDNVSRKIIFKDINELENESAKKEALLPEGVNRIEKLVERNGTIILIHNSIWPKIYKLDTKAWKFIEFEVSHPQVKKIYDYQFLNDFQYIAFVDNEDNIFVNKYESNDKLLSTIKYESDENIIGVDLVIGYESEVGLLFNYTQARTKENFFKNSKSTVKYLSLNFEGLTYIDKTVFNYDMIRNGNILNHTFICKDQATFFWLYKTKKSVFLKSEKGYEKKLQLPKISYPGSMIFNERMAKKVFVNFDHSINGYSYRTFGAVNLDSECKAISESNEVGS